MKYFNAILWSTGFAILNMAVMNKLGSSYDAAITHYLLGGVCFLIVDYVLSNRQTPT